MSKIYSQLQCDFTQIPNHILLNTNVSALAFKIYAYICYRIGTNKEWEFFNREILLHFKEKRNAFFAAKNQLIEQGYLEVINQKHKSDGTFSGCDYIIYKEPYKQVTNKLQNSIPCADLPNTVEPNTENRHTYKYIEDNNKDQINSDNDQDDCLTSLLTATNVIDKFISITNECRPSAFMDIRNNVKDHIFKFGFNDAENISNLDINLDEWGQIIALSQAERSVSSLSYYTANNSGAIKKYLAKIRLNNPKASCADNMANFINNTVQKELIEKKLNGSEFKQNLLQWAFTGIKTNIDHDKKIIFITLPHESNFKAKYQQYNYLTLCQNILNENIPQVGKIYDSRLKDIIKTLEFIKYQYFCNIDDIDNNCNFTLRLQTSNSAQLYENDFIIK